METHSYTYLLCLEREKEININFNADAYKFCSIFQDEKKHQIMIPNEGFLGHRKKMIPKEIT